MTKEKNNLNTRSRTSSRSSKQRALSADSNRTLALRPLRAPLPNQRVEASPPQNQNKEDNNGDRQKSVSFFDSSCPVVAIPNEQISSGVAIQTSLGTVSGENDKSRSDHLHKDNPVTSGSEGDNREPAKQTGMEQPTGQTFAFSKPEDPWHETFTELRALRARMEWMDTKMEKLDKIEESTTSLSNQVIAVVQKTSEIETKVSSNKLQIDSNSTKVRELTDEISSLKQLVQQQGQAISGLSKFKDEIIKNNKRTIGEINDLAAQQKEELGNFQANTKRIKADIKADISQQLEDTSERIKADIKSDIDQEMSDKVNEKVSEKVGEISQELSHKDLKDQAFRNRNNLVVIGLQEDPNKSTQKVISEFFNSTLKIKGVNFNTAYRIGASPEENSSYSRPIIVQFSQPFQRNKVWKKRMNIPSQEGSNTVRIQADLPKQLREDVRVLYRVVKAAASFPEFKAAAVRDYAIYLNGRKYNPRQLESLPKPIRPSTLAERSSDDSMVFFSRHSVMSNHYPSKFTLQDIQFHNVEQYLAYKRALTADQQPLIQKSLHINNPAEAKSILNSLKNDHPLEWANNRATWATEAVRAKFTQNPELTTILLDTKLKCLGEASRDVVWGIGMDLDNPHVLDPSKWATQGNLLGGILMSIREEIKQMKEN